MPQKQTNRKQLFRAALAIADMTAGEWASAEGFSAEHLSLVLNGHRIGSATLMGKIDGFIKQHMGKRPTALAS